jgi:AcrR family transcriptional regulator
MADAVSRILDGAVRALSRRGSQKLTMSDICAEAGVSRGTLYRYFKCKDDVLEAVGAHVTNSLRWMLEQAIRASPEPADRLRVILDTTSNTYRREFPESARIPEVEPGFAINFLTRHFPEHLDMVTEYLKPVLDSAPPVHDGIATGRQLAELFHRVVLSTYFIPSADSAQMPDLVTGVWQALVAPPEPQAALDNHVRSGQAAPPGPALSAGRAEADLADVTLL